MENKVLYFRVPITDYTLADLKNRYREHFGYKKSHKVTKKNITLWIAMLFESDIQ